MTYVDLDDLGAPELPDRLRAWAERQDLGEALAGLDPESLLARAAEQAGTDDFGDGWFREPLTALCRSLRTEAGLSAFGALAQQQQLLQLLRGRLRVEQLYAKHPEIADVPLAEPIVVAGLPRSGTTFLHSLLGADERMRLLADDETTGPPEADAGAPSGHYDQVLEAGLPHMKRMLPVDEESAQEEIRLLGLSCASVLFETQVPLPSYRDWYLRTDQTPAYRYLARTLRALHWLRGGERWALKTMQHVEQIPALLAAFPDAVVVRTHRDPAAVAVSIATMLSYGQRLMTAEVDPARVGGYWAERVVGMTDRCVETRAMPSRVVDVTLAEIRDDPDGVVDRVYAVAGLPMTEQAREAMARLRAERHPHRFGRVRYDPAVLGIDPAAIRARTERYRAEFGVPAEG